jgi:serine phosphatase RsbU (regulator of sigma subunit)
VESTTIEYTPGHTLLLYSDGVTDAQNEIGEMFEEERLHAAVMAETHPLNAVKKAIGEFINGRTPDDDISLITLRL